MPPSPPKRLLAATGDSVAAIEMRNGRATATLALEGSGAACVARDPRSPATAYAGCRGGGVRRTEDAGRTWEDAGLGESQVFSISVSAADGAVYAGCEPSMLFRSRDGGSSWTELFALREIPSAPTWSFPPRPWTSHVRWIAPNPEAAQRLLVGIELGGVMLTDDGGKSWLDHRPGAQPDCHALAWHPSATDRAYEAGGGGAAWSFDGGQTWRGADEGRDRHYTWALAVDPEDPDRWYVSASTGPGAAHRGGDPQARIFRWQESGPWEALDGGLPDPLDAMPYALTFAHGGLYAGLSDGRIYRSADRGESWDRLEIDGDGPPAVIALAWAG